MATIIFDLDGTLVDTAPDLIDTLNIVLGREGLPPVAYEEARALVGYGARRMIERGLASAGTAKSAAELDRMFADFIAHYADHIADRSRVFPGVEQALDALTRQGCRFAVCTNKLEWLSVRLLERSAGRTALPCRSHTPTRCSAPCARPAAAAIAPSWWAIRGPISRPQGRPAFP
jgi:phosphoglycolate phosphatase